MANIKTVILTGTEEVITDLGGQNVAIKNLSAGSVYASAKPNVIAGADNVIEIPADGGELLLDAQGTVYLLGSGKVQLTGTNYATLNFKLPSSSEGGGGGTGDVTRKYVDAQDETYYTLAKSYTDSKVNSAQVAANEAKEAARNAQSAADINTEDIGKLQSAVETAQGKIFANTAAIANNTSNIAELRSKLEQALADIAESEGEIDGLSDKVRALQAAIDILNGTGKGSVTKTVADEIAKIIADAPESFDTLEKIADWIQAHPDSAADMNEQIIHNAEDIADINNPNTGILANAKRYADDKSDETLDAAKKYTDTKTGELKANVAENASNISDLQSDLEKTKNAVSDLNDKSIVSARGAFDLRYYDGELEANIDGNWNKIPTGSAEYEGGETDTATAHIEDDIVKVDVKISNEDGNAIILMDDGLYVGQAGGGIPPENVSDLRIRTGNAKLTIFWSDPGDLIEGGEVVSKWKGTKLVQKVGSYPESPTDGVFLVDNRELDKYKTDGFTVNGLTNGETYYFALFPYSVTGAVNTSENNRISGTPKEFVIMTAVIDLSNSNPETSVTYEDDAVKMTPESAEWDEFFGHYPCLFKDGQEVGKLNRDNFDEFEDGGTADISSGNAGDAMIAFPRRGLSIKTIDNKIYISMTDDPDNPDFEYNAHTRGEEWRDVFYLGVYKGCIKNEKLWSLKNASLTQDILIANYRTCAQTKGNGYEQSGFYQLTFRQAMFVLKYKTLDSQSAVGMGYSSGSNFISPGGTEDWGMDCELIKESQPTYMTDAKHHVKCFGLEDCWGNVSEWIDGVVSDSSMNILTANNNFNNTGSGYTNNGNGGLTASIIASMSVPLGSTKTGFVVKAANGSQDTYFCDRAGCAASCVAASGGAWTHGKDAGVFFLNVYYPASQVNGAVMARLMYL